MSESKVAPIAAKLRASVLQQAVEGKLVPQNPDDEPSSVLLERIQEERAELVKQKKAKAPRGGESRIHRGADGSWYEQRGKAKPVCIDKEIPFDIPENWEWTRLGAIAEFGGGGTPDKSNPSFWGGDIPWASMKDIHGDYLVSTLDSITKAGLSSKQSISICEPGELIVSTRLVPGKSIISRIRTSINQDLKVVHVTSIQVAYLHAWFQSNLTRFKRLGSGTTVPGIKLDHLKSSLLPVPPISEQQRIVERINEIMPLIDRLEKLERESDAVDSRFWRDLPSSILQQAVEGKLVPQDPDDEPSSVLLERIRKERAELVKQKKAKAPRGGESRIHRGTDGSWYEQRGKAEPVCIDKEIPFGIPDNWAWSRLIDCSEAIVDCPHSTPKYLNEDTGYYAIDTNCMDYGWNQTGSRNLSKAEYEARTAKLTPQPNDIVLSREASIGRAVILSDENYCLGQRVMLIRSGDNLDSRYLQLLFTSPYAWNLYRAMNQGTGVKHINVSAIRNMLIPVPPLAEQRRIATKVFEIRAMLANRFIASAA